MAETATIDEMLGRDILEFTTRKEFKGRGGVLATLTCSEASSVLTSAALLPVTPATLAPYPEIPCP